jgi:ketosteroid isomerase-like protein
MSRNRFSLVAFTASALIACLTAACSPRPLSKNELARLADTRAADEAAVRKADADWVQAAQSKQADAWVAFYADDAVVLPPNDKMANSKESIHKVIADLLALPGLSVSWQATKVEAARSGDLAYIYGTYELTSNNAKGKPVTDHGKYAEVWKKQSDGGWKCIVDTWSSDLPAAPASR